MWTRQWALLILQFGKVDLVTYMMHYTCFSKTNGEDQKPKTMNPEPLKLTWCLPRYYYHPWPCPQIHEDFDGVCYPLHNA